MRFVELELACLTCRSLTRPPPSNFYPYPTPSPPPSSLSGLIFRQAKARASTSLTRLLDEKALPGSLERTLPANAGLWPPAYAAAEGQSPLGGASGSSGNSSSGGAVEPRRVSRREPPTVLLVREGAVVATLQDGTKTTVTAGAWRGRAGAGGVLGLSVMMGRSIVGWMFHGWMDGIMDGWYRGWMDGVRFRR